jgi:hypothetical protein
MSTHRAIAMFREEHRVGANSLCTLSHPTPAELETRSATTLVGEALPQRAAPVAGRPSRSASTAGTAFGVAQTVTPAASSARFLPA